MCNPSSSCKHYKDDDQDEDDVGKPSDEECEAICMEVS